MSTLYIGGAFYTLFALWFKKEAYLGMYIGLLLGAVISGTFTIYALLLAWGNVLGVAVVGLGFKYIKILNYRLVKYYDYIFFLILVFLGQIVSSNYTIRGLNMFGLIPDNLVNVSIYSWIVGGIIVNIIIAIPLLKIFTPIIEKKIILKEDDSKL
jgi:hypothetical protein